MRRAPDSVRYPQSNLAWRGFDGARRAVERKPSTKRIFS